MFELTFEDMTSNHRQSTSGKCLEPLQRAKLSVADLSPMQSVFGRDPENELITDGGLECLWTRCEATIGTPCWEA